MRESDDRIGIRVKLPEEAWPDIRNGNHVEARRKRVEQLDELRSRVEEWVKIVGVIPQGGPSRAEMSGIVANLRECVNAIDPDDER